MNIFNRIVVVLLLLCLVVLSLVSVVNIFANLFKWSDVANRIVNSTSNVNIYFAALILLLLLVVSFILLIFEFYKRKAKTVTLTAVKSGEAMVDLKSASQHITEELLKAEDISNVKVKVVSKSDGVIVNIYAKLAKGLNVSQKMQQIMDKASRFASENLGLKIIKTNFTATGFTPERIARAGKVENIPVETITNNAPIENINGKDSEKSSNIY
jgi:uncharacterized alkaline shock family protein YloU